MVKILCGNDLVWKEKEGKVEKHFWGILLSTQEDPQGNGTNNTEFQSR